MELKAIIDNNFQIHLEGKKKELIVNFQTILSIDEFNKLMKMATEENVIILEMGEE